MAAEAPDDDGLARAAALERWLLATIGGSGPAGAAPAELVVAASLPPADREALAAADGRRLGVYRALARAEVGATVAELLPRTAARLGPKLAASVGAYLDAGLPRSRFVRDVPFELVRAVGAAWARDPDLPTWLPELARFELVRFRAGAAPRDPRGPSDLGLEPALGVRLCPTLCPCAFEHAVHRLPEDPADRSEPDATATALACYRDADNDVVVLALSPLGLALLARLALAGEPLGTAVAGACADVGTPLGPAPLDELARLLADLAARGVVLGAEPASGPPLAELAPELAPELRGGRHGHWLLRGAGS
ncbi:MAG: hypothetical protein HY908_01665 [Myxococcales bacterium]|nr:hypothetical protein [Myxococcales bacterium]